MIPPPLKIRNLGKAVSHGLLAAQPRSMGKCPYHLLDFRRNMPVLMHNKRITFGTLQHKHTHVRKAFKPNVVWRPLYSRALDMMIWSCVSTTALREIDAWGGFDEYIVGISSAKLGNDSVTLMYKRKIQEAMLRNKAKESMDEILQARYGPEFIEKLQSHQR